mmetsp:Transcript_17558/g.42711  ORF Transcript_17558/g.42711 Transcript_17558/m.42711 type:complete len:642 (-) Transcript_17558:213-2138(-)
MVAQEQQQDEAQEQQEEQQKKPRGENPSSNGQANHNGKGNGDDTSSQQNQPQNYKTLISATQYTYTFVRPGPLGLHIGVDRTTFQSYGDPGGVVIIPPYPGKTNPTGIEVDDRIISIGGTDVSNKSFNAVVDHVRNHPERPLVFEFQAAPLFPRPHYTPVNGAGPGVVAAAAAEAAPKNVRNRKVNRTQQQPQPHQRRRRSVVNNVCSALKNQQETKDGKHLSSSSSDNLLSTETLSELKALDSRQYSRKGSDDRTREEEEDYKNSKPGTGRTIKKPLDKPFLEYYGFRYTPSVEYPTVTDAHFDKRFWTYSCTPEGGIHCEKLVEKTSTSKTQSPTSSSPMVTPTSTTSTKSSKKRRIMVEMMIDNESFLEDIPDEPPRKQKYLNVASNHCIKPSRVGPLYQAGVSPWSNNPRLENHDDVQTKPSKEGENLTCIWDPKKADEAEKRGEDIDNFLGGDMELKVRENRMTLLHKHGYNVAAALEALQSSPSEPTSMLTEEEAMAFDAIILNKKTRKRFAVVSETLKRSRVDCQIHYYKWKATNRKYKTLKSELKEFGRYSDYCVVCEDGGDLLVCDGCSGPYHLECIYPPLDEIPEDDWFCRKCTDQRARRGGNFPPLSPVSRRRSHLHMQFSTSSPRHGIA